MFYVSDISAIEAVVEGAAPRPIKDVLLEIYPDAVIDANGRAHAPCDGYVHEDVTYRGGEYLPFPDYAECAEEMRGGPRVYRSSVFDAAANEIVVFEGSKGQMKAARAAAKEQQAEIDRSKAHVGAVKKRESFDLTVFAIFFDHGVYGPEITHYMRDASGNPVVYKGSKLLAKEGEKIAVKATVKSHWTAYDGRVATYISRPAII